MLRRVGPYASNVTDWGQVGCRTMITCPRSQPLSRARRGDRQQWLSGQRRARPQKSMRDNGRAVYQTRPPNLPKVSSVGARRLLPPRPHAASGKARERALLFGPHSALRSSQYAATAGNGLVRIARHLLERLRALAAQFLHTRTDRGKVVGNAGSGHVPSLNCAELRKPLSRLLKMGHIHSRAWAWAQASKNQRRFPDGVPPDRNLNICGHVIERNLGDFGKPKLAVGSQDVLGRRRTRRKVGRRPAARAFSS
jgi:hypothetical protein